MSIQRRTAILCDHHGPECDRELVAIGGDVAGNAAAKRAGWVREAHGNQRDVCPVCQWTSKPWQRPGPGRRQLIAAGHPAAAAGAAVHLGLQRAEWELLTGPHQVQGRREVDVALAYGYYENPLWTEIRDQLRVIHQVGGQVRWSAVRS